MLNEERLHSRGRRPRSPDLLRRRIIRARRDSNGLSRASRSPSPVEADPRPLMNELGESLGLGLVVLAGCVFLFGVTALLLYSVTASEICQIQKCTVTSKVECQRSTWSPLYNRTFPCFKKNLTVSLGELTTHEISNHFTYPDCPPFPSSLACTFVSLPSRFSTLSTNPDVIRNRLFTVASMLMWSLWPLVWFIITIVEWLQVDTDGVVGEKRLFVRLSIPVLGFLLPCLHYCYQIKMLTPSASIGEVIRSALGAH